MAEQVEGENGSETAAAIDVSATETTTVTATAEATALVATPKTSPSVASTEMVKTGEPEAAAAEAQLEKPKPVNPLAAFFAPKRATSQAKPRLPKAKPARIASQDETQPVAQTEVAEAKREKAKPANPLAAFFAPKRATPQTKSRPARVASLETRKPNAKVDRAARRSSASGSLPGVRSREGLFGIIARTNQRNGSDTRNKNNRDQLASAGALAGVGRQIFQHQRKGIRSDCFPRALVNILRQVERHYGKRLVITSGYRSRSYNRRIRGARNSTHTRCMAADIQVKGVSKWALAKYLRSIPGRGGVGTYCWTKSVHIDVGAKRAWHYCNRRKKRSRKRRA
ncbi:MAG: D-Ala-D-Ala carboxypeptidase family metallohydrolase [Pseudomonadota bacterium]